jgi:hypothetical protein
MTVRRSDSGTILLEGTCPLEDSEPLLEFLQADATASLDWSGCRQAHTAVLQLALASGRPIAGPCGDPLVRQWIEVSQWRK